MDPSPNPITGSSSKSIKPLQPARKPKTKPVIDPLLLAELDHNQHEIQASQAQISYMRSHARVHVSEQTLHKQDRQHPGTPLTRDERVVNRFIKNVREQAVKNMSEQGKKWTGEMKAVKVAKEKLIQLQKAAAAEGKAGAGDVGEDKSDAGNAKEDAGDVKEDAGDVKEDAEGVKGDAGDVKENAGDAKEDVGDMKEDAEDVKEDAGDVKEDVGDVKEDAGGVKENAGGVKENAGGVKEDAGDAKEDVGTRKGMRKRQREQEITVEKARKGRPGVGRKECSL